MTARTSPLNFPRSLPRAFAVLAVLALLSACGQNASSYEEGHLALRWPDARDQRPRKTPAPSLALDIPYLSMGIEGPGKPAPAPLSDSSGAMVFLAAPPDAAHAASFRPALANYREQGPALPVWLAADFELTPDVVQHRRQATLKGQAPLLAFGLEHIDEDVYVSPQSTPVADFVLLKCGKSDACSLEMGFEGYQLQVSNFKREWLPHWKQVHEYIRVSFNDMRPK